MGKKDGDEEERLKGKFRFRAVVRKVIINLAWLTEEPEEEKEEEEGGGMERAVLKAKARRRRESAQGITLEEKLLFSLLPESRTEHDVEKLFNCIKRLKNFMRFPEDVQKQLAECLYFAYIKENRTILREGHEPESVYFIMWGDVLISVEKVDPYSKEPIQEHLAMLSAGDMFGEVALLYNIRRTATVTANSVVELLGLHKDDFARVLHKTLEAQWQRFQNEVARFSYFDNWSETQMREVCILGRLRSYDKDETILGDGCGTQEYAYFLLSGTCRVIQTITVEVWEEFGDTVYRLLDDPTLVAVRTLPAASSIDASERAPSIAAEQLAAQDEWRLAGLLLAATIGYPAHSQQWKAARGEVERVLKKEEPFKHKSIVHSDEWDQARQMVINTLGEHTTRGSHYSRSTEQLHKLFGRSMAGAPPSASLRRMSMMSGMSGRHLKLPSFVGSPAAFIEGSAPDEQALRTSLRKRKTSLEGFGPQAEFIRQISQRLNTSKSGLPAEQRDDHGREPLQLELVRGERPRPGKRPSKRRIGSHSSHSSFSSRHSSVIGFASELDRQRVVTLRHEFEDPFERTPRERRMSLTSKGSIRNAWTNAVRVVVECMDLCEEGNLSPEQQDEMRELWSRACKGIERFMKKEQVPVMRPHHRISCHFVQVCFYMPLQVFGIGESMEQRRVSAVCPVECLLLPRYWLEQNNVANVWERLRLYLNRSIPDTRAVFRGWAAERRWLRHRQHVVEEQINRRPIDSGTTPYDVPYSLRLNEINEPHELGYRRRYVIRPEAQTQARTSARTTGKVHKTKPI